MKISVIIPTLNEEKFLGKLLGDLKKQTWQDFEVIVADAHSTDETRVVAKKYGARVVDGGMPAVGRNAGAAVAKGDFLYFLDADVRLKKDFLAKSYAEIEDRFLDLATCELVPISDLMVDKVLHQASNVFVKLQQYSSPVVLGCCILVSKRLFERVNGFDESLKLGEDYNFAKRASEYRNLRVLLNTKIDLSVRRLQKDGRVGYAEMILKMMIYRGLFGEIKKDIVDYEFGKFDQKNKSKMEKMLVKYDKKLSALNKEINVAVKKQITNNRFGKILNKKDVDWEERYQELLGEIKELMKIG